MGSALLKRRNNTLKINNVLPKNEEILKVLGEIVVGKDKVFHIMCFDIKIDGFFPVRVRWWPQNHSTRPPTPEFSATVLSLDSEYDCQ